MIKRYSSGVDIDTKNQIIYTNLRYAIKENDAIENYYESLKLKYYYPEQLLILMEENSFDVINKYGYYDFSPFNENTSSELILECKALN